MLLCHKEASKISSTNNRGSGANINTETCVALGLLLHYGICSMRGVRAVPLRSVF